MLNHPWLIRVERQALAQGPFCQVIGFFVFLQTADMVQGGAKQTLVRLSRQEALAGKGVPLLEGPVFEACAFVHQPQVDVCLTESGLQGQCFLKGSLRGRVLPQLLLNGGKVKQGCISQRIIRVGQPQQILLSSLLNLTLLLQGFGLLQQFDQAQVLARFGR